MKIKDLAERLIADVKIIKEHKLTNSIRDSVQLVLFEGDLQDIKNEQQRIELYEMDVNYIQSESGRLLITVKNDDNKHQIAIGHALDQLKAAMQPMFDQLRRQVDEIDNALNEMYCTTDGDEIKIVVNGVQYPLGLWHTDAVHIFGMMLQDMRTLIDEETK